MSQVKTISGSFEVDLRLNIKPNPADTVSGLLSFEARYEHSETQGVGEFVKSSVTVRCHVPKSVEAIPSVHSVRTFRGFIHKKENDQSDPCDSWFDLEDASLADDSDAEVILYVRTGETELLKFLKLKAEIPWDEIQDTDN